MLSRAGRSGFVHILAAKSPRRKPRADSTGFYRRMLAVGTRASMPRPERAFGTTLSAGSARVVDASNHGRRHKVRSTQLSGPDKNSGGLFRHQKRGQNSLRRFA